MCCAVTPKGMTLRTPFEPRKAPVTFPARYWWLRSPNPWNGNNVRNVTPSGALNNNNANNGNAVAAACFNGPSFE